MMMRECCFAIAMAAAGHALFIGAAPVAPGQAGQAASRFAALRGLHKGANMSATTAPMVVAGTTVAHVVTMDAGGYVVMRADDEAPPVKLYNAAGALSNLPPAFLRVLEAELAGELSYLSARRAQLRTTTARFAAQWQTLLGDAPLVTADATAELLGVTVGPLLTMAWNQNYPYNYYAPIASGGPGGRAYAGCVAAAMAMILRYHQWPVAIATNDSYYDSGGPCVGTHAASDATPFFYTRNNNDEGIWEWKNKGIDKNSYGLYVFGLNDSIGTTEFLEENHNAQLEIAVFNYTTGSFDPTPCKIGTGGTDDPYGYAGTTRYVQYEKSDGVYCGLITPDHISASGGIKLKIIAHGLSDKRSSGFAWFDYAYLAPGFSNGKLNINTAPARVLRALPGVTAAIAEQIFKGTSAAGRDDLKPYKNPSDILDVRGVTPEVFSKIANLITTRSDQFRVRVLAQSVLDVNRDGLLQQQQGDKITGERRMETVVDRHAITDDDPLAGLFDLVQGN